MNGRLHVRRLPLLAIALIALLFGLWSGLLRLSWTWQGSRSYLLAIHGPLMVGGFLGTVISLERAVAVERRWAYAAPTLTGLGAAALLIAAPIWLAALLITLGSVVTIAIFVVIIRIQPAIFTYTIGLGALLWAVGNALWLWGWNVPRVVLWWVGFLVLTIAGERLELSRLLRLTPTVRGLFVAATGLLLAGLCVALVSSDLGTRIAGAGLGVPMQYSGRLYSHLILLHLALIIRVLGDLTLWWPGRLWGGSFNAVAILLFLANTILPLDRQGMGLVGVSMPQLHYRQKD